MVKGGEREEEESSGLPPSGQNAFLALAFINITALPLITYIESCFARLAEIEQSFMRLKDILLLPRF